MSFTTAPDEYLIFVRYKHALAYLFTILSNLLIVI